MALPAAKRPGYIQAARLDELWIHTGTICNLSCPFCLEGSSPGDDRLQTMTLEDARPHLEEAYRLGVRQISVTGGEPFVVRDTVRILDEALDRVPCLVLTNGTRPLRARLEEVAPLRERAHPLSFRVSLDSPDPGLHDAGRGSGAFTAALETLGLLHSLGFGVSIARRIRPAENGADIHAAYSEHLASVGIREPVRIVAFPDFLRPAARPDVPKISEDCMTRYHTEESRAAFMCGYSRMVVKRGGSTRVFACTLVDDDDGYDLGPSLAASLAPRVLLRHHRCFSCFADGASCSELDGGGPATGR